MDYDEEVPMPLLGAWTKDHRAAAARLTSGEARFLVDTYYQVQKYRCSSRNQAQMATEVGSKGEPEPNAVVSYLSRELFSLESRIKTALLYYVKARPAGLWAIATYGVGPVIAAGYLSQIDFNIADSAGSVWKLCGVAPGQKKVRGQKTDFNPRLKRLTFLLGQSFMKFSGRDECYYGKIYLERKAYEMKNNEALRYKDQAEAALKEKKFGEDTQAKGWYDKGMLPPARIELRAERYAAKMFLSHFFEVAYFVQHNKLAPAPFPITHLGHIDRVECPNKHLVPGMLEAESQ